MNNRWKIVEYYIYTRTKQEDFVLKQVEVLIDAPEKAKKLCHILSGHKGAFDLAKGRYTVDGKSIIGICTMDQFFAKSLGLFVRGRILIIIAAE